MYAKLLLALYNNSHMAFLDRLYSEGHEVTITVLFYEYMDQHCKHNGIPLSAHFIYLNFDFIYIYIYIAETCRRTKQ